MKVVAARSARLAGYQVDVFSHEAGWLAERVAKQAPMPLLTLKTVTAKKERESFNFVVTGEKCSLLQMMSAPTELFGFDNPIPPAEELSTPECVNDSETADVGVH